MIRRLSHWLKKNEWAHESYFLLIRLDLYNAKVNPFTLMWKWDELKPQWVAGTRQGHQRSPKSSGTPWWSRVIHHRVQIAVGFRNKPLTCLTQNVFYPIQTTNLLRSISNLEKSKRDNIWSSVWFQKTVFEIWVHCYKKTQPFLLYFFSCRTSTPPILHFVQNRLVLITLYQSVRLGFGSAGFSSRLTRIKR